MFFSWPYVVLPAEPWTISRQARRTLGFPASVRRAGVIAGNMDSRNGRVIVAPMPRSIVRREICFFVMNILASLILVNRFDGCVGCCRFRSFHLECRALDDTHDER